MKLVFAIFLALLFSACAYTPTAKKPVAVTGSHIKRQTDPDARHPATPSPVMVYDREDLESTGEAQLDGAIKKLSPAH